MPEISRFFGVRIAIFYDEHNPPHFHAWYQGFRAAYSIENSERLKGKMPENLNRIISKWARKYKKDLTNNWNLAKNKRPLKKIKGADQ